jgi:hypothetical protein
VPRCGGGYGFTADPRKPGRAYTTWVHRDPDFGLELPSQLDFSRTTDGGGTWSPPRTIDQAPPGELHLSTETLVLPNGALVTVFTRIRFGAGELFVDVLAMRSRDKGQTWRLVGSRPMNLLLRPLHGPGRASLSASGRELRCRPPAESFAIGLIAIGLPPRASLSASGRTGSLEQYDRAPQEALRRGHQQARARTNARSRASPKGSRGREPPARRRARDVRADRRKQEPRFHLSIRPGARRPFFVGQVRRPPAGKRSRVLDAAASPCDDELLRHPRRLGGAMGSSSGRSRLS